jgi:hypothetical protein
MIYELRVYRVVEGRMAALHDTLRTSNLADNGPPWHPAGKRNPLERSKPHKSHGKPLISKAL